MDDQSNVPSCEVCAAPMTYIGMLSRITARPFIVAFKCAPCGKVRSFSEDEFTPPATLIAQPTRDYEARIVGPRGGVADVRRFKCATDAEATERARSFVPMLGVELWCSDRFIGRYPAKATPTWDRRLTTRRPVE
jgi:hypothetical protein